MKIKIKHALHTKISLDNIFELLFECACAIIIEWKREEIWGGEAREILKWNLLKLLHFVYGRDTVPRGSACSHMAALFGAYSRPQHSPMSLINQRQGEEGGRLRGLERVGEGYRVS